MEADLQLADYHRNLRSRSRISGSGSGGAREETENAEPILAVRPNRAIFQEPETEM